MNDMRSVLIVAVIALATMATRFLPFILFGRRETPAYLVYLGRVLPYATMGMLVVFCLKGVSLFSAPYGIPELLACAVVAGTYIWKRNTLISIVGGTVCYMLLVQLIF